MARTKPSSSSQQQERGTVGSKSRAVKRLHGKHPKKKHVFEKEAETLVALKHPKKQQEIEDEKKQDSDGGEEGEEHPKKHRRVNRFLAALRNIKKACQKVEPILGPRRFRRLVNAVGDFWANHNHRPARVGDTGGFHTRDRTRGLSTEGIDEFKYINKCSPEALDLIQQSTERFMSDVLHRARKHRFENVSKHKKALAQEKRKCITVNTENVIGSFNETSSLLNPELSDVYRMIKRFVSSQQQQQQQQSA